MRKYLLPNDGSFYKANLHCHSTVSDGVLTPNEIKEKYIKEGYSIVAYTDHEVLVPHPELADESFLPLNGVELKCDEAEDKPWNEKKTCHICYIALDPDNHTQICYHRSEYIWGNAATYRDKIKIDENEPDFIRDHNQECINEMMKRGREKGFFVTYNHPVWSLENYMDYMGYEHMHAMEIVNFGCLASGYNDYNEREYEDMLRGGKRIYCIAADDNHNDEFDDSFGGFTMIKAEKLEYKAITDALMSGNFYASQGPEIYDLWFEDGKICVTCSDACMIRLNTGIRRTEFVTGDVENPVTKAIFNVNPQDRYVRITVTDKNGKHANTNAYFTDELFYFV